MENKELLNNPFYCLARDAMPIVCRKYGLEQTALLLNILHDNGLSAEDACALMQFLYPLSPEEITDYDSWAMQNYIMAMMMGGWEKGSNGN
jgi:hypothetical protein